jgi:Peptidase family M20/M25/M40
MPAYLLIVRHSQLTDDEAVDLLHEMLTIGSPLGQEQELAAFLAARLAGGELNVIRHIPAVRQSRANPAARALTAAIRRHGGQPRPLLKTGTSDMNAVSERWSMPMAAYGPGDSSLDHGSDERILISEYLQGVEVLVTALGRAGAGREEGRVAKDGLGTLMTRGSNGTGVHDDCAADSGRHGGRFR